MRGQLATALVFMVVACSGDSVTDTSGDLARVTLINGYGANIDVLVDGEVKATGLASGDVTPIDIPTGTRTVAVRSAGIGIGIPPLTSLSVALSSGHSATIAALKTSNGNLVVQSLADTNAVVPAGATKLRVLHLAARSGEVQVWRTQPDYQTPIRWAFPFTYNTVNVYYQSTPGTWEVRAWMDSTASWSSAQNSARVTLAAGSKKTVAILDRPGGGIRLEVIDQ